MGKIISKKQILIDIGSSTVKTFELENGNLNLILNQSFPLKKDFSPERGITKQNKKKLFGLIKNISQKFPNHRTKTFATALFRKLNPELKNKFIYEFYEKTGLYFNIIDHSLESFYLQTALTGKFTNSEEPVLLINIGGGSSELIILQNNQVIESYNLDFGVGTINSKFSAINNIFSGVSLSKIINFSKQFLPVFDIKPKIAFLSGNELLYMQIAGYKLDKNIVFSDYKHPSSITLKNFSKRTVTIFPKSTFALFISF